MAVTVKTDIKLNISELQHIVPDSREIGMSANAVLPDIMKDDVNEE
jgi:hypothetical protein